MKYSNLLLAVLLSAHVPSAFAQVALPATLLRTPRQVITMSPDGQAMPISAPATPNNPRTQRFQQLQFDRRPSTILKAWMTPEKPDEKKSDAPAEPTKIESDAERPGANASTPKSQAPETPAPDSAKPGEAKEAADSDAKVTAEAETRKAEEETKKAEAAKKAAEEKAKAEQFEKDLARLQRNVTLGHWPEVKSFLATLPTDEGRALYLRILQSLQENRQNSPQQQQQMAMMQGMPQLANFMEKHFFTVDDLMGLWVAAPTADRDEKQADADKPDATKQVLDQATVAPTSPAPLTARSVESAGANIDSYDEQRIQALGALARVAIGEGNAAERFVQRIQEETGTSGDENKFSSRQAAKLLFAAGQATRIAPFLPSLEKAMQDADFEALILLSRYFEALYSKDRKYDDMERSWKALQAMLATGKGSETERDQALRRAISLAPTLRDGQGNSWIEETFRQQPDKAIDILATVGALAAKGILESPTNPSGRKQTLELQKTAVESFLATTPERAPPIKEQLSILASNWAREAQFTRQFAQGSGMGPRISRDMYGNIFYMDEGQMMTQMPQGNQPMPIPIGEILEIRPNDAWLSSIDEGLIPHFASLLAQLYLKGSEEEKAFPFIASLAQTHPEQAKRLAREFLDTWIKNHNPNETRSRTNPYMYFFGFEQRAESIPLTRSKQQRNLVELSNWVRRLRELPLGELDEALLARAFTTCHSSAEVYQLDGIETVFGPIGGLKPKTLAGLANQMRQNLAGLWRDPKVQQQNNTKRKPRDIQAEVLRGYAVASAVLDDGLEKFPDSWELAAVKAALAHDELSYRQELEKNSAFVPRRAAALDEFKKAAEMYASQVSALPEEDQSTQVFDQWFHASLGACDLNKLSEEQIADPKQPPLIRDMILSLPGEIADRHMTRFANALFTRMGSVNPAAKFRYLKAGFEVVGDHKSAWEARKVFDYYHDLVTEIKLETTLDGNDAVGEKPFGLFVNLRHTREIERESGGFAKYLQNQNRMSFSYNYGRPTQDYRDKFQTTVQQAFGENFEVLSVTFETDKVASKATHEYGWRVTPYAYVLLKARGPQIDKIPPVRLDLDFLDTSGYVIIPIESPPLPVDSAVADPEPRPAKKMEIAQTLDERQAKEGKLVLEIKATARGLVPDLDAILDLNPKDFETTELDDQGIAVSRFDADGDDTAVISERTWLVHLRAKPNLQERPKQFAFAGPKIEGIEITYQRYQDADLVVSEPLVTLEAQYGNPSHARYYVAAGVASLALLLLVLIVRRLRRPKPQAESRFALPENITPFTVLGLLRRIERNNGLDESQRQELLASLARVEQHYFADDPTDSPDLRHLAETWLRRAR